MQVECGDCGRCMDYSGARPSFCGYCGKPLPQTTQERTAPYDQDATATRPGKGEAAKFSTDPPPEIRGYRMLGLLGSGGMGAVYQAEDLSSGRRVALKLISPEFTSSSSAVERFRQEGRLASLIAHPRCVFVLAADEDGGRPYIVMELMSGSTLQELVEKQGPLPQTEAVAKILDVIEGLQEAHRLGVIHRDVKPSNCFVVEDGRVKVGDFGLAKSLIHTGSLTRTGTFLGTLLYAPPEQIKGETIDVRTDVYSVCATLYFLLTGRAPYQGKDAAATLARTVSEPPPGLRVQRPEVSPALEKVVLRGLDRQREERWRDLEELRLALLRFAPGQLRPAGYAVRFGAFILDMLVFLPLAVGLNFVAQAWLGPQEKHLGLSFGSNVLELLPWWLLEGWFGWSLGKWLLHLRVCTPTGGDPPGLRRAALRFLVFYVCLFLPMDVIDLIVPEDPTLVGLMLLAPVFPILGVVILILPMRARSGYRGLHEWCSGTRVVRLPWPERQRPLLSRQPERLAALARSDPTLPVRLGPYELRGTLCQVDTAIMVLGEDPALGRKIWLRLVHPPSDHLPEPRKQLSRSTRLPWLTGGVQDGLVWDAFLAPAGCPLADLVDPRAPLTWGETRPILFQMCEELLAADKDGTLPPPLSLAQVWVQPNGRLQLLDTPFPVPPPGNDERSDTPLRFLRQTAILALEGQPDDERSRRHVYAPVPAGAAGLLDRLIGGPKAYQNLEAVHADLIAKEGQPTQITRALRSAHLALLVSVLAPLLLILFGVRYMVMLVKVQGPQHQAMVAARALDRLDNEQTQAAQLAQLKRLEPAPARDLAEWRRFLNQRNTENRAELMRWEQATQEDWLARALLETTRPTIHLQYDLPDPDLRALLNADPKMNRMMGQFLTFGFVINLWIYIFGCVLWALAFRGGFTMKLVGISLRRRNGRPAARWQCAWRTFLFWLPPGVLLSLSLLALMIGPEFGLLSWLLWLLAALVLACYLPLALWRPERALHDRLAGTYLMPS